MSGAGEAREKALGIIRGYEGTPLRIMEVCGTHTHAIFAQGIRKLLPSSIRLISGPGCPVCVTGTGYIDEAVHLALGKGCTVMTFGDLLRVPGTEMSLQEARARGGEVRIVYSPLDAAAYAREHPEEEVVFLSVGFETTVPAALLSVQHAARDGLANYSLLTANKTMDEAYRTLKGSADAYLYPGHVCAITGMAPLRRLAEEEGISGVVAGFTANEIIAALALIIERSKTGRPFAENAYPRVVTDEGSPAGRALIQSFTEPCDDMWRGIGLIRGSGLRLKEEYALYDARRKYDVPHMEGRPNPACRCGEVLMGKIVPNECPLFGKVCTPDQPTGACMVSSEGTCSAYYKYGGL